MTLTARGAAAGAGAPTSALPPPRDWVVFAFVAWTGRTNRGHHLARELALAGDRVLWIDPPEPLAAAGRAEAEPVAPGIWRSPGPGLTGLSPLGQQAWARGLRASVAAWRAPGREVVAFVQAPDMHLAATGLVGAGLADLLVWDALDDWRHALGGGGVRLEVAQRALARRADLVVAVSEPIAARTRALGARRVELVPNGCRPEDFPPDTPPDPQVLALPGPRLVYAGGIDAGLDLDALAAIPAALPGASVVLVGPLLVPALRPALAAIPGLVFLGEQPYARLPGIYAAADVCLLPFRLTPFNVARDSLKLYEYLAAGRPVVATATPQALRLAETVKVVPAASCGRSFAEECERVVKAGSAGRAERGRNHAQDASWWVRARAMSSMAARSAHLLGEGP